VSATVLSSMTLAIYQRLGSYKCEYSRAFLDLLPYPRQFGFSAQRLGPFLGRTLPSPPSAATRSPSTPDRDSDHRPSISRGSFLRHLASCQYMPTIRVLSLYCLHLPLQSFSVGQLTFHPYHNGFHGIFPSRLCA